MHVESQLLQIQYNIKGLSNHEVNKSRLKHGWNEITQQKREGFLLKFLSNFGDPIIKILLAALFINLIFAIQGSSWFETVGIGIAIFLATLVFDHIRIRERANF